MSSLMYDKGDVPLQIIFFLYSHQLRLSYVQNRRCFSRSSACFKSILHQPPFLFPYYRIKIQLFAPLGFTLRFDNSILALNLINHLADINSAYNVFTGIYHHSVHCVFKFSDIARPVVVHQHLIALFADFLEHIVFFVVS